MYKIFVALVVLLASTQGFTLDLSVEDKIKFFLENERYNTKTKMCELMHSLGSDKGGGQTHNYTTLYSLLFQDMKDARISIFEMGIGTNYLDVPSSMGIHGKPGASLRGWAYYFPNAQVFGADVDSRILFQEPCISTFYCDQTNENSVRDLFANQLHGRQFDIMIDDGLHSFDAALNLLVNSIQYLKQDGFYIVEDLPPYAAQAFEERLESLKQQLNVNFVQLIDIPPLAPHVKDNKVLVIQK